MSRNDWMYGEVTLPSAEVAKVRAVLNAAYEERRESVVAHVARLWEMVKDKPVATRYEWLASHKRMFDGTVYREVPVGRFLNPALREEVVRFNDDASEAAHLFYSSGGRKPTAAVYAKRGLAPATNRRTEWHDDSLSVYLKGRTLKVSAEGNHGVESAFASRLGVALFEHLEQVAWTARSGGELVGNDEYNQEDQYDGGGANYVVRRYESESARKQREKNEARYWKALMGV